MAEEHMHEAETHGTTDAKSMPPVATGLTQRHNGWLVAGIIAGALFLIMIASGIAFALGRFVSTIGLNHQNGLYRMENQAYPGSRMMMGGRGGYTTSGTIKTGVVTSVDGTTLTVAGDGTTIKVVTDSSTTYTGATTPVKVNDTVRIATNGAQADGSFKAITIYIGRQ